MTELAVPGGWGTGWNTPGQVTANTVIIIGPNGGEFIYDNANHLRSANVGATTTDPVQGLSCKQGFSTFNGFGAVLSLLSTAAAAPGFFQYFDNNSAVQGGIAYSFAGRGPVTDPVSLTVVPAGEQLWSNNLALSAGATTATIGVSGGVSFIGFIRFLSANGYQFDAQMVAAAGLFSTNTAGTGVEVWHSMSLLNSWANAAGNTAARYRLVASPPNSVEIQGVIDATAATNSRFFTLPAGYVPTGVGGYGCGANGSVSANQSPQVRWDASGNLSVGSFTVGAAAAVWVNGFINLD